MGQKVNPHGLRVGVIKDWDSRWYARNEKVGDLLVEDKKIRDFLKDMDVYDITEEEYKMMSYYGLDDIGYDVYELFYNVACCCGFDANEYYDEHKN